MDLEEAVFLKKMLLPSKYCWKYFELEGLTNIETTSKKQIWLRGVTVLCAYSLLNYQMEKSRDKIWDFPQPTLNIRTARGALLK